jgi:hypothetical protein
MTNDVLSIAPSPTPPMRAISTPCASTQKSHIASNPQITHLEPHATPHMNVIDNTFNVAPPPPPPMRILGTPPIGTQKSHTTNTQQIVKRPLDPASYSKAMNLVLKPGIEKGKESMSLRLAKDIAHLAIRRWAHERTRDMMHYSTGDMDAFLNSNAFKRRVSSRYENGTAPNIVKAATMMRVAMHRVLGELGVAHDMIIQMQGSRSSGQCKDSTMEQVAAAISSSAGWTRGGNGVGHHISIAMIAAINNDFDTPGQVRIPKQYAWNHIGKSTDRHDHQLQTELHNIARTTILHRVCHDVGTPMSLKNSTIIHLYAGAGPVEDNAIAEALGITVLSIEMNAWNWHKRSTCDPYEVTYNHQSNVVEDIMRQHGRGMSSLRMLFWSSPCSVTSATEGLFKNHGSANAEEVMKHICAIKDDCMRVIESQALKGNIITYYLEQGLHSKFWRMLVPNKDTSSEHHGENLNVDKQARWPVPHHTTWGSYGSQMHKQEGICTNYASLRLLNLRPPTDAVPLIRNTLVTGVPDQPEFHGRDNQAKNHTDGRQMKVQEKRSEWPRTFVDHVLMQHAQHSGDLPLMGSEHSVLRTYPVIAIPAIETRVMATAAARARHESAKELARCKVVDDGYACPIRRTTGSTDTYLKSYKGQTHYSYLTDAHTNVGSWVVGTIVGTRWIPDPHSPGSLGEIECTVLHTNKTMTRHLELEVLTQRDTWSRDQARTGRLDRSFDGIQWVGKCNKKRKTLQHHDTLMGEQVYTITYDDGDMEELTVADIWWLKNGRVCEDQE